MLMSISTIISYKSMTTAKIIPRYFKGTFKGGLHFEKASSTLLSAFSDGD
jgi:hypothetical protein